MSEISPTSQSAVTFYFATMSTLQLESSDGHTVEVTRAQAQFSGLLTSCLDDMDSDVVPIAKLNGAMLQQIVNFLVCADASGVPKLPAPLPADTTSIATLVEPCFAAIVDPLTRDELGELMMAADFMQVDGLITLCAAKMAIWVRSMTEDEIAEFFNLPRDSPVSVAPAGDQ